MSRTRKDASALTGDWVRGKDYSTLDVQGIGRVYVAKLCNDDSSPWYADIDCGGYYTTVHEGDIFDRAEAENVGRYAAEVVAAMAKSYPLNAMIRGHERGAGAARDGWTATTATVAAAVAMASFLGGALIGFMAGGTP